MAGATRSGCVALLVGLLGAAPGHAEGFRNAMPYAQARETFKRLGYKPYFMPGADICDPNDLRCYPELESCAKSRTWACTYTWRRGRAIIEVETRYDNPVVARSDCIVNCSALPPKRGVKAPDRTAATDDDAAEP